MTAILFLVGCASLKSECPGVSVGAETLKTTWVGYEQDCLVFYRIQFDSDGRGFCGALYVDGTVDSYRVQWKMANSLKMDFVPLSKSSEPIKVQLVSLGSREMQLTVEGVERKWKRRVTLYKEKDLLERIEKTRFAEERMHSSE